MRIFTKRERRKTVDEKGSLGPLQPNLRRRRKTMKAYIRIDTFEDIMRLNDVARSCDYDMYIESGAVRVNPKSVMGIFSIGTKKVVSLTTKDNDRDAFLEKFGSFINGG